MSRTKLSELATFTDRFLYIVELIIEKNSINQSRIAKEIGLSTAALSKLKNGDSKSAAGTTLSALQSKFGVNPVWLAGGEGEPFLSHEGPLPAAHTIQEGRGIKFEVNERGKIATANMEGWGRILNTYIDQDKPSRIGFDQIFKAMQTEEIPRTLNAKLVTFPVKGNRRFDHIIFYLASTPIQGYLVARDLGGGRIIQFNESKETHQLIVKGVFSGSWSQIAMDRNIEYRITLSRDELADILSSDTKKHEQEIGSEPEEIVQQLILEKNEKIEMLQHQVKGLEEDKADLRERIKEITSEKKLLIERVVKLGDEYAKEKERLQETIDELKRELATLEKGSNSA